MVFYGVFSFRYGMRCWFDRRNWGRTALQASNGGLAIPFNPWPPFPMRRSKVHASWHLIWKLRILQFVLWRFEVREQDLGTATFITWRHLSHRPSGHWSSGSYGSMAQWGFSNNWLFSRPTPIHSPKPLTPGYPFFDPSAGYTLQLTSVLSLTLHLDSHRPIQFWTLRICSFNLICQFGTWVSDPDAVIP